MQTVTSVENKNGKYSISKSGIGEDGEPLFTVDAQLTAYSFPVHITDLTFDEAKAITEEYSTLIDTLPWDLLSE